MSAFLSCPSRACVLRVRRASRRAVPARAGGVTIEGRKRPRGADPAEAALGVRAGRAVEHIVFITFGTFLRGAAPPRARTRCAFLAVRGV